MSLNGLGLGFTFTARDAGATATMGRIERGFFGLQRTSTYSARNLGLSYLFIAQAVQRASTMMVRGLAAIAKVAADFEQAMANVKAVSGATPEEFARLTAAAKEAGLATKAGPIGAANALALLAQAGFTVNDQLKLLQPTLLMTQASMGELTDAKSAEMLGQVLKGWSLPIDEASISVDRMVQAANKFSISFKEMPRGFGAMVGGAQAMQQSFEEVLIAYGLVRDVLPGIKAATGVNNLMQALAGRRGAKVEKDLGIRLWDDTGNPKQLLTIVKEMGDAMDRVFKGGRSGEEATRWMRETLNPVAATAFGVMINQLEAGVKAAGGKAGQAAIDELRMAFSGAGFAEGGARGAGRAFEDIIMNTFGGQKALIKSALESLFIEIGDPIVQAIKPYARYVLDFLRDLTARIKAMSPEVKEAIAKIAVGLSALLAGFGSLVTLRAGIALFATSLQLMGLHTTSITIAVVKLLAVLAPLALLGAAAYVIWDRNIGGIQERIAAFAEKARLLIGGVAQLLREGAFTGDIMRGLSQEGMEGTERFAINIYAIFWRVQRFLEGVWFGFSRGIDFVWPKIEAFLGRVDGIFTKISDAIFGTSEALGGIPSDRFRRFGETVGVYGAKAVGWLVDIATWLADQIPAAIEWLQAKWAQHGPYITLIAEKIWGWFGKLWDIINNLIPIVRELADGALTILVPALAVLVSIVDMVIEKIRASIEQLNLNLEVWKIAGYVIGVVAVVAFGALALAMLPVVIKFALIAVGILLVVALFYALWKIGEFVVENLVIAWNALAVFFSETLPNAVRAAVTAIQVWFSGVGRWFSNLIDSLVIKVADLVSAIPEFLRPGFAGSLVLEAEDARKRVAKYEEDERMREELGMPFGMDPNVVDLGLPQAPIASVAKPGYAPESHPASAAAAAGGVIPAAITQMLVDGIRALAGAPGAGDMTLRVPVVLDGEKIAEAVARVDRKNAARGFGPRPPSE